MTLVAQELIDDAKLQAWPFMREEEISPASLLRQLTSLDREIVGLIATQAPDTLSLEATPLSIVQATNPTGYTLQTLVRKFLQFTLVVGTTKERLPIEIVANGAESSKHPAAYVYSDPANSVFFPIDPIDRDWDTSYGTRSFYQNGDTVEYRYITEPPRITTMAQQLSSPDEAEPYIKDSLALTILLHSQAPPERLQVAVQLLKQKREQLQHDIIKKTGVTARYGEF